MPAQGKALDAGSSFDEALGAVYETFFSKSPPKFIPVCSCCVSEEEVYRLRSVPLRQLTPGDLSSYASSAFLTSGSEPDFRYYLPRILEILVNDQEWWPSKEIVLRSLSLAGWENWRQHERDSLHALFRTAFQRAVSAADGDDIDSWVCGLAKAGADLSPYLQMLEDPSAIQALVCFYELNSKNLPNLNNAFWGDEEAITTIAEWFESAPVSSAILTHYGL